MQQATMRAPARSARTAQRRLLLVDAHAHFHECFQVETFLNACAHNIRRSIQACGLSQSGIGVLLLAETTPRDPLHAFLRDGAGGSWSLREADDGVSVVASLDGEARLVLVAGRQVVTAEGLEVLALTVRSEIASGCSLHKTVGDALTADAIVVLPWGVGKWLGRRGRVLRSFMQTDFGKRVFLGDNAGRLRYGRTPALLGAEESSRKPILSGSDPLPFPGEARRAGSFGFMIDATIDLDAPGESIRDHLRGMNHQPQTFGERSGLIDFVGRQTKMQFRNRVYSRLSRTTEGS